MSQIIHSNLVVGLSWSVLSSEADQVKNIKQKIRKKGNLVSADKYIVNSLGENKFLGLYNQSPLEPNKRGKLYSLSMLFISAFDTEVSTINSILLLSIDGERQAMVVVEGGQVTQEVVIKNVDVANTIKILKEGLTFEVFSDSNVVTNTQSITLETLLEQKNKANQLNALPANVVLLSSIFMITAMLAAAGIYYQNVILPEKKQAELLLQNAQQNHTPQYLAQLSTELKRVSWKNEDLKALILSFKQENYFNKGWAISLIRCDSDSQGCEYRFERQGGEIQSLIESEKDKQIDTLASTRDTAVFRKSVALPYKEINRQELKPLVVTTNDFRNHLQKLVNAGATVGTVPTAAWPTQGLEMSKVDKAVVVQQTGVEIRLNYPLIESFFDLIPSHTAIKEVSLIPSQSGEKANTLVLTLKGASYANP